MVYVGEKPYNVENHPAIELPNQESFMKFKEMRMTVNDEKLIPIKVKITVEEVNLLGSEPDEMKIRVTAKAINTSFPKKVYHFDRIGSLMRKFPNVESILAEFETIDKNLSIEADRKFFRYKFRFITLEEMNGAEELYDLEKYKETPFVFSAV